MTPPHASHFASRLGRIAVAGFALAAFSGAAGLIVQATRLGHSNAAALERAERDVRAEFEDLRSSLAAAARAVTGRGDLLGRPFTDTGAGRTLFEIVTFETTRSGAPDLAITVYSAAGTPVAWSGRPSEIPPDRVAGPPSLFVAPGPLGLRLVHVEPVVVRPAKSTPERRVGAVAAERVLSRSRGVGRAASEFILSSSVAPVVLRTRYEGAGETNRPGMFRIRSPSGETLIEAEVVPAELERARLSARRDLVGIVLAILAGTITVVAVQLLDWRRRAARCAEYTRATWLILAALAVGRALLWFATPARWTARPLFSPASYASSSVAPLLRSPVDFLLTALTVLGVVALLADAVRRLRLAYRRKRQAADGDRLRFVLAQFAAGTAVAALVFGYELFLNDTIENTTLDVLHFSLHPWSSARLALMFGLLCFHAAVVWAGVLSLFGALAFWRIDRGRLPGLVYLFGTWSVALAVVTVVVDQSGWHVPLAPVGLVTATCMIAAYLAPRAMARFRHASQALRLFSLFLALAIPALLMYPSVLHFADVATRRLIEAQYAVQAQNHPQELQARLSQSLHQIDRIPALPDLMRSLGPPSEGAAQTDTAFLIWRQTDLAEFRLTSAIELYGADGALVSRFALNFPEYAPSAQKWQRTACHWDVFGEAAPFGSAERRMLHAERAVCDQRQTVGAIVVHVMLDYSALPFISSKSPYFEFFRTPASPQEGMPGGDVELVIYGWGGLPEYTSGTGAWPIGEELFRRIYVGGRQPFWTTIARRDVPYRVYVTNDRAGIYVLGYPVIGSFGHLVHVAELATLAGLAFAVLVVLGAVLARLAGREPASGRHLLREVRASFYRKLFLAFVAASIVPVITLAFAIRIYFAAILRADVEAEAARTAAVAERVIEESAALQQRGPESLASVSDDVMVWISQVIDQDVNIFAGPRLLATSERDLFASGLLPTRTPNAVYRAIVLQRLPSFVGDDEIGDFRYMLAAAPVRLAGRDAILTVPLALRQQEIEREIDEFDRGVYLAALVFILLGAGIGLSMAERIADPVKRLTRATRRVARGDFDARVAVKTADELKKLVDAFNSMAAELKHQAAELERTHRLEAWADMARQVAHEIKNPLTPIQLSAEHLRRVHDDRHRPLSPVLEGCVDSILGQVRLLRQIAAEFSSFASSPTPRPASTDLGELVEEVIEPYRAGLASRIRVDVNVPATLPKVFVDRTLLGRALTNILENALHAMPGGGRILVTGTRQDGRVRLDIRDTGVGMDDEAVERIFEPYFSTKAIGTGLGLTIAKRNVELNGGTIDVRSEKGEGTTVTITFPYA